MRLIRKGSRPSANLCILGGQWKSTATLPIIYSAGDVSNKVADVEQEACPWRYLLIDVMCVFMEAWPRGFIPGYKETLEWADSKYSSKRTLGKAIIKNHPQNLYPNKEVTTLFSFKRRGGGFQTKWAGRVLFSHFGWGFYFHKFDVISTGRQRSLTHGYDRWT